MTKAVLKKMTKADLIATLSDLSDVSKDDVLSVYNALLVVMGDEFAKGHAFMLQGILKIWPAYRPARIERMGRNPRTGESLVIPPRPAKMVVKFAALSNIKETAKNLDPEKFAPSDE